MERKLKSVLPGVFNFLLYPSFLKQEMELKPSGAELIKYLLGCLDTTEAWIMYILYNIFLYYFPIGSVLRQLFQISF